MAGWFFALALPLLVTSVQPPPKDCSDIYNSGHKVSGVYPVYPAGLQSPVEVYCDMGCESYNEIGGWTVFQRRLDGSLNFYRNWEEYKNGFGFKDGEYWLGLEWLHQLTGKRKFELKVDMVDFEGNKAFAQYSTFSVGSEEEGYKLTVGDLASGGAGNSLAHHNGQKFSTFDKDQDSYDGNCAKTYLGAFWYNGCHHANPNGIYLWGKDATYYGIGVNWYHWKGHEYSLKFISMKIRPVK
uniref:Fibrinogen C-terminal domain-containing protein n=1 Tax=Denticeps clupeoides TaxID=299321 RepID=A0AAY4BFM1_9TELE